MIMKRRFQLPPLSWILWLGVVLAFGGSNFYYAPERAVAKLTREGYRDFTLTGWQPFAWACDGNSGIAQGFHSTDARGTLRTGYVCTSPFFSYIVD